MSPRITHAEPPMSGLELDKVHDGTRTDLGVLRDCDLARWAVCVGICGSSPRVPASAAVPAGPVVVRPADGSGGGLHPMTAVVPCLRGAVRLQLAQRFLQASVRLSGGLPREPGRRPGTVAAIFPRAW